MTFQKQSLQLIEQAQKIEEKEERKLATMINGLKKAKNLK